MTCPISISHHNIHNKRGNIIIKREMRGKKTIPIPIPHLSWSLCVKPLKTSIKIRELEGEILILNISGKYRLFSKMDGTNKTYFGKEVEKK